MIKYLLAITLNVALGLNTAQAEHLEFIWDHPEPITVQYYVLYLDKADIAHITSPDAEIPPPTTYVFDRVLSVGVHTFWVTAVGFGGAESKRSNAYIKTTLPTPIPRATPTKIVVVVAPEGLRQK